MGLTESKECKKEALKKKTEQYVERLETALIGCDQAKNTFATLCDLWSGSRLETMDALAAIADDIDRHHCNVNIASLTGTSSSIAGGTAAIASLAMAPFSGGTSMVLAAGGLFGAVAGTATTLGANVVEVILTRDLMEKAKKVLDIDAMYTNALADSFRELVIHENEVIQIMEEIQSESLTNDLNEISGFSLRGAKSRHLSKGKNSFADILALMSCLYSDDSLFLSHLKKTEALFQETPTLSSAMSTSTDFFQALKELSNLGPETLRNISGAALQTSAASSAQVATLGTKLVTFGLGTVFVALDIYHLITISKNYDEGSKTELAIKIRNCISDLQSEKEKIEPLGNFYKERLKNITDYS